MDNPPLGAERRGGAAIGRVRFAAKTGQLNGNIAKILFLGRLYQLEDLSEVDPDEVPGSAMTGFFRSCFVSCSLLMKIGVIFSDKCPNQFGLNLCRMCRDLWL